MKTKKIISMLLTLCIVIASMAGLCVSASAETVSTIMYSGSGYTASATDSTWMSLYAGERLSGANGEKYTITYEGKNYTNVTGYHLTLCDGDKKAQLYYKQDNTNIYDTNKSINYGTSNPFNVKVVIDVDFSLATPTAAVKVYDHDLTTVLVDKTVALTGFTGISDVVWDLWNDANITYSKPVNPTIKVEKQIEVMRVALYSGSGYTASATDSTWMSLYAGERLSGANGEKYTITYVGKNYTNVDGYHLTLCDGDNKAQLYYKDGNAYDGNKTVNFGTDNPFNVKVVIDVDFSLATPTAAVKVYDHDLTTVLVGKTVTLTGFTGISDVVWDLWSAGNITYSKPVNPTIKVEQLTEVTWTTIHSATLTKENVADYYIYTGDLSLSEGSLYSITWEGTWYHGGIDWANLCVEDSDTDISLFFKHADQNGPLYGDLSTYKPQINYTSTDTNPRPFKFVIDIDYLGSAPKATVNVYDIDKTTHIGTITKDLTGIDSIKGLYWHVRGNNYNYTVPFSNQIEIKKAVFGSSEEEPVETKTLTSATASGNSIAVDMDIVAVDADIPYALIAAYYSGSALVYADIVSDTVVAGDTKEDHTFTIPGEISGNYNNVVIYLWDGVETIVPYDAPVPVN